MFGKTHTLYRPPGEADSLIIRVANGCSWNGGMYKGIRYSFQESEKAARQISNHWKMDPAARRIFLAYGDVMLLDFQTLGKMLLLINHTFGGMN